MFLFSTENIANPVSKYKNDTINTKLIKQAILSNVVDDLEYMMRKLIEGNTQP